ncbi:flavin reductase family protein [Candidatus Woesearchaeota archaeon]|nr:flavin reductase family protein [Candidatus Woesearchaeota archaeon]
MEIRDVAYPRQVILVSCRGETKSKFSPEKEIKDNVLTLSWHMPISNDPPLYAIAIGKGKYSLKLIRESSVFVVNFMPTKLEKEVLFCGRNSGEHMDKFKEIGLEKEEADRIDCCRIKQALAFLECHVVNEIDSGDHIIIIGKILNIKKNKEGKRIYQAKGDIFTTTVEGD